MYWLNKNRSLSVFLPKKQVIPLIVFLICLLCCIIPVHAELTPHKNGQFKFVTVTVVVKDINGEAVKGAEVKAFSEDWGVMYPHFEEWGSTDSSGVFKFEIPIGNWTFRS